MLVLLFMSFLFLICWWFSDPIFHSGGGGLFSTIDDCDKFSQLIVNKGKLDGAALVNEKIFNSMTSDNIGHLPKLKKTSYGSLGTPDLSGHGFGIGPAAGQLAADVATASEPLVDPTPFRFSRFSDGFRIQPIVGI